MQMNGGTKIYLPHLYSKLLFNFILMELDMYVLFNSRKYFQTVRGLSAVPKGTLTCTCLLCSGIQTVGTTLGMDQG